MTLAPLFPLTKQFQDTDGQNLVAGQLKVYLNGTDDIAESFADASGSARNPFPIVLDNNGMAPVWIDSSKIYRLEVFDRAGGLLFTRYPMVPMGGGSGSTAVNIESTDGSIQVSKTAIGSQVNYDLSVNMDMHEGDWIKCIGAALEGGVYVPQKSSGTMDVGSRGIELEQGKLYHVTVRIRAVKGEGRRPFYDEIDIVLGLYDGENTSTISTMKRIVDLSLGLLQEFEVSTDVYAAADGELTIAIANAPQDLTFEVPEADVHRIYSGVPKIPADMASKAWVTENYQKKLIEGDNIHIDPVTNVISATGAAQVNSDWNASSGVAEILNKPNLATVATSGSYNDLSDKPTIPSVPVQDVQVDGSSVVNAQGVAEITTPTFTQAQADWNQTNTSAADYIKNKPNLATVATSGNYSDLSGRPSLATVATSGLYSDLIGKPTIPAAQQPSDWDASTGVTRILNKPTFAAVAYSGAYADLSGKPTMPTVDQTYSSSSTNAQSGTAVAEAIANSKELPDIANKANLFLQVNSAGTGLQWAGTPKPSFQRFNGTTSSVTIPAGDYTSSTVAATLAQTISAGDVFVGDMVLQLADFTGSGGTDMITLGYKAGTTYGNYEFRRLGGENTYVIPVNIDNQYGSSPMSIGLTISGTVFASTTFTISLNGLLITV